VKKYNISYNATVDKKKYKNMSVIFVIKLQIKLLLRYLYLLTSNNTILIYRFLEVKNCFVVKN